MTDKREIRLSATAIENYMDEVMRNVYRMTQDTRKTEIAMYPIEYYTRTGRAGSEFMCALLSTSAKKIATILVERGGSDYEVMRRIKHAIGWKG